MNPEGILVTGANGFVGRALCRELAAAGYRVRGAVRAVPWVAGIASVEWHPVGDVGPDTDWRKALDGVGRVVHLAARAHVMKEPEADPLAVFRRVNAAGTACLAAAAAQAGVRRLVLVSSVKVNGEASGARPFGDDDAPHPQDPYAVSKWEAEQALWRVARESGMEAVVLRPPLVYGPGVKGNFHSLLKAVAAGVPLPLGAIRNRRSLVYLGNLTDALSLVLFDPRAAGRTFLVSDGEDLSTPDLVRRLAAALGRRPRLIAVPVEVMQWAGKLLGKSDAVARLVSSLTVEASGLRTLLGWRPPFTLDQGLTATAAWYRGADPRQQL